MSGSLSPTPDAPIAAAAHPVLWVLLQVQPRIAVLAMSEDRDRVVREARDLAAAHGESRDRTYHLWLIRECDQVLV